MKYNYNEIVDRSNTNSLKWDINDGELPMWVADMDIKTAPEIVKAIEKRVSNGIFGYSIVPESWNEAYVNWWKKRHSFIFDKNDLIFTTGVIPAISSIVRKLTTPAEKVLIQTPVYNMFYNCVLNNGRFITESPLIYNGTEYTIDFNDLEEKLADTQTKLMILCNPHNPIGKIWDKATLIRIGELCHKHGVTVLSDEIHCDITRPGKSYVPFASVSDICRDISVTCVTPTKAFNIAGLNTAAVIVPNKQLRYRVSRGLNTDECAEPNAFAIDAAIAAFNEGGEWLDGLCEHLYNNIEIATNYIDEHIPELSVVTADATYLMWIDCSLITSNTEEYTDFLRKSTGLYISSGKSYGECGKTFVRINIACPEKTLQDGLNRLKVGTEMYKNHKVKEV